MRGVLNLAVGGGLVLATFAVYAGVGGHSYVNLDDDVYVLNNPWVREGISWAAVRWAFTTVYEAYWIPLTWLSLALDCRVFGLDAGAHLVENVVLHATDSVLLYALLVAMTGAVGRSAWVAALFALHPLHVESVAWVSQRKDVLSTLFWMLTTLAHVCYARRPNLRRYGTVVLPFALGLLAKPMLVTLPVTLLLLDWWPLARRGRGVAALVAEKLPLFALSLVASAVTIWTQQGAGAVPALASIPLGDRVATALTNYALYLGKLVWPTDLAVFYPLRPGDGALAAAAALLLALISVQAVLLARRAPYVLVGWLWYLVTLLPVIGFLQVGGQQIADRYTYLPSIGIFVIAAWGAVDLVERRGQPLRYALAAVAALLVVVAAVLTHRQVPYWQDSITLFARATAVTTRNFLAENNLGEALAAAGRREEAAAHYAEAVRIHPGYAPARNNHGISLAEQGRYAEAEQEFRAALAQNPRLSMAASNLGTTRARLGDYDDALVHYRHAIELEPTNGVAYEGMADSLVLLGRLDEAIARYRDAIRWSNDPRAARRSVARTLRRAGRDAEAAEEEALLDPGAARR
jgi:tetratricopeptide (TPR) repeat protein